MSKFEWLASIFLLSVLFLINSWRTNTGDDDGYFAQANFGTNVDCNDSDPNVYPGSTEVCDGKDNDCDGVIPENEPDEDNDGHFACLMSPSISS